MVPFDDPGFWQGAGATGLTAIVAVWLRKITKKESLEERLQRWQESTVQRVQQENASMRVEMGHLKEAASQIPIMKACLSLAVDALHRIAPDSPELRQIGALLSRAMPIDPNNPDDMQKLLHRIRRSWEVGDDAD